MEDNRKIFVCCKSDICVNYEGDNYKKKRLVLILAKTERKAQWMYKKYLNDPNLYMSKNDLMYRHATSFALDEVSERAKMRIIKWAETTLIQERGK